jgi:hypothetical protein
MDFSVFSLPNFDEFPDSKQQSDGGNDYKCDRHSVVAVKG